jgi:ABC-type Zn uptake system ZnuABC Zn-binding protein ZnuA
MVCGSGYAKVGANRFGCSAARNKGSSVCSNRLTISRQDTEDRVLHGLQHHWTDPDLLRIFCEEYTAELGRLRSDACAQRGAKAAELGGQSATM